MNDLKSGIVPTLYSTALHSLTFATETSFLNLFSAEIPTAKLNQIYQDPNFGVKSIQSLIYWVNAATDGEYSDTSMFLMDYFDLKFQQVSNILTFIAN